MKLREITSSRAGDKGDTSNVSLIVYDMKNYPIIRREVTVQRVKRLFKGLVHGRVKRYELPNIGALNFVMEKALGGGVSRSLAIDRHGKSYSSLLLEMDIEPYKKTTHRQTHKD